jgi:hypothetical protein
MPHVEIQSYHLAGWHVHCDRQTLSRCCASSMEPRCRPNPLDRTGNRCVHFTIQRVDLHSRGCLDLAAQLGNRAGIERTVGVGRRLRLSEAADMHGRHDLSCAPVAIVKPGVTPVVGEATRIEYLDGNAPTDRIFDVVAPVIGPRVGLPGLPARIADQPARRTQIGLKDQDTGLAECQVRRSRHPIGFRRAIILDVHRQDILAGLQVGREVE